MKSPLFKVITKAFPDLTKIVKQVEFITVTTVTIHEQSCK